MMKNVFEESELTLRSKITGGKPEEKKQVKFAFEQKGGGTKIAEATVELKNDIAEHKIKLPKIKDDEDSYTLSYSIEGAGQCLKGEDEYRVWPKNIELEAVDKDAAEVVILGGGPIAGLAREAAGEIPVPTLDGVSCGVRLAEALVGLAPRPATRGSFARPPSKPTRGLSPSLVSRL